MRTENWNGKHPIADRIHLIGVWSLFFWSAGWVLGQDPHAHHRAMAEESMNPQEVATLNVPEAELVDQEGRRLSFFSDLVKGKTVVINSIFTTCTTICPPMGANYARLQSILGDRVGRDVFLISLSVDPVVDTPPRLKAWSEKFGARPGWTLVTGGKAEMDRLLKALKFFTPDKLDHTPTVLVGNETLGKWKRAYGLASADDLAKVALEMAGMEE